MKKLQWIAVLIAFFGVSQLQAQITSTPYFIYNGQNCDITVYYRAFDPGCNHLCTGGPIYISPGTGYNVPCAVLGGDVYVIVTEMNYIPIGGGGSCDVSVPGGCLGFTSSNTAPLTAAEQAALNASGCGSPTGNCYMISTGGYTKVGY